MAGGFGDFPGAADDVVGVDTWDDCAYEFFEGGVEFWVGLGVEYWEVGGYFFQHFECFAGFCAQVGEQLGESAGSFEWGIILGVE